MSNQDFIRSFPQSAGLSASQSLRMMHIDPILMLLLLGVVGYGLVILYSAVDRDSSIFSAQALRMCLGLVALVLAAQLRPNFYLRWAPMLYVLGAGLLIAVLIVGVKVKGSQRWLELPGLPRFQPSELMKIAVPMMLAWYFRDRPLPPTVKDIAVALVLIAVPAALIMQQPDLGTGILVAAAGLTVILLAGVYWRWMLYAFLAMAAAAPAVWYVLQEYQRQRILTLFDPQSDPLGAGWNIIQSTTAIGSGGLFGKGLFQGTQSHLDFLPESQTDFIIAVVGEELGFFGLLGLLLLYMAIVARGLVIASQAQNNFGRLLAGALTLVFFVYLFVNIAMVAGLLPVVGVPLPLVSYGGTSAITLLAGFGIIMSIRSHKVW
ncbi:MAG: rod shape-determining protein RodA [Gammaproteobacteria bacterium]|nr:rod shape-determining protein RodA [Gammaproteobacteria bacterium]